MLFIHYLINLHVILIRYILREEFDFFKYKYIYDLY